MIVTLGVAVFDAVLFDVVLFVVVLFDVVLSEVALLDAVLFAVVLGVAPPPPPPEQAVKATRHTVEVTNSAFFQSGFIKTPSQVVAQMRLPVLLLA